MAAVFGAVRYAITTFRCFLVRILPLRVLLPCQLLLERFWFFPVPCLPLSCAGIVCMLHHAEPCTGRVQGVGTGFPYDLWTETAGQGTRCQWQRAWKCRSCPSSMVASRHEISMLRCHWLREGIGKSGPSGGHQNQWGTRLTILEHCCNRSRVLTPE